MLIYLVTNKVNGKVYVGKLHHTKDLEGYFRDNLRRAERGYTTKPYFYNAVRKYRAASFSVEQIDSALSLAELNAAETRWILHYKSNVPKFGYNLTTGGEGNPGHVVSDDARRRIGNSRRGKPLSAEHKKHLSEAHRRNPTRFWQGKKRTFTEEHKKHTSEASKKMWEDPEYRKEQCQKRREEWRRRKESHHLSA
jgi:hypothetical protein